MSDQALQNAMAERETLAKQVNEKQQQLEGLRRELARVDAFIADWHRFAGTEPEDTGDIIQTGFGPAKRRPANSKKEEVASAAVELLKEAGKPLSRSELYKALTTDKGMRIEGTEPEMVLSTMLWRMGEKVGIERLKTGGYWFKDEPVPPAKSERELFEEEDRRRPKMPTFEDS